jgi:hypothetical protein
VIAWLIGGGIASVCRGVDAIHARGASALIGPLGRGSAVRVSIASHAPIEQRTKATKKRNVKKPAFEEEFFFMTIVYFVC